MVYHGTVLIKDQTACFVQSELDLPCWQKALKLYIAAQPFTKQQNFWHNQIESVTRLSIVSFRLVHAIFRHHSRGQIMFTWSLQPLFVIRKTDADQRRRSWWSSLPSLNFGVFLIRYWSPLFHSFLFNSFPNNMSLQYKSFEDSIGKGEIAPKERFLLFP